MIDEAGISHEVAEEVSETGPVISLSRRGRLIIDDILSRNGEKSTNAGPLYLLWPSIGQKKQHR
jgi:hypothetical protein